MLWAIYCISAPDSAALRKEHSAQHRSYLDANEPHLFFAGGLQSDDATDILGAVFILNVKDRDAAEAFIDGEPFNQAGVFEEVSIFRLGKGRFNRQLVDAA